jgi:hypothetical protein
MFKEIFIYGLYYIIHASPPHHPTPNGNKMHPSQFANHGSFFCLFVVPPLQNAEGLDNHLGSYPGCLDELGISCAPNWAATLKLPSVTTSSKAINHHLFCVKTKAELATNHLVEVTWHDKNAFDTESSMPDSPSKCLKCSSAASIRGTSQKFLYLN